MVKKKGWQTLAGLLEIPRDIILDLPRITMQGNGQMLVENHKGIIEYTTTLIRVNLVQGQLLIKGENLVLESLQTEHLLITGRIGEICYDL